MYNIYEVLQYGPVVTHNEELEILVTANGSYLNLWVGDGNGRWENTDCRPLDSKDGLYAVTGSEMMSQGEAYLKDKIAEAVSDD